MERKIADPTKLDCLSNRILDTLALGASVLTSMKDLKELVRLAVRDIREAPSEKTWKIAYDDWGNIYNEIFYRKRMYH